MTVGNEEREVERFAPRTSQKLIAQANDAAPRVQDQRMLSYFDFDTGGIFPLAQRLQARGWIPSQFSPKTLQKTPPVAHMVAPQPPLTSCIALRLLLRNT